MDHITMLFIGLSIAAALGAGLMLLGAIFCRLDEGSDLNGNLVSLHRSRTLRHIREARRGIAGRDYQRPLAVVSIPTWSNADRFKIDPRRACYATTSPSAMAARVSRHSLPAASTKNPHR